MTLPIPAPDRTAVVTGASSGIGAAIARELARRGHGVTLVARRADRLAQLASELAGSCGVRAESIACDLSDRAARATLLDRVAERGLTPDVLVNNAGLSTTGRVAAADVDAELNLVEVDVAAVVDLCTRATRDMVGRGRGAVLNVASTAAFQPIPGQAAYAAAKAFVLSYSRSLRAELRGTGVAVTALCPGPVDTEFVETAGFSRPEAESALPRVMWKPVDVVARAGVDGLERGHPVVIPGAANRVSATMASLTPKRVLTAVVARRHPALRRPSTTHAAEG